MISTACQSNDSASSGRGTLEVLKAPPPQEEAIDPFLVDYDPNLEIAVSEMTIHPSGILWHDDIEGTGPALEVDQTAVIRYTGWFPDGLAFDSTAAGTTFSFRVGAGEVIDGLDVGIVGMKLGGKRKLIIPPEFGYGDGGLGAVPPNSILVFGIELVEILP